MKAGWTSKMKPYGKLSQEELLELPGILTRWDPSVLLGPAVGEDTAIVDLGDRVLVAHSDPIAGGSELAGWLSAHVVANDVATRGVEPSWLVTTLLLPQTFSRGTTTKIGQPDKERRRRGRRNSNREIHRNDPWTRQANNHYNGLRGRQEEKVLYNQRGMGQRPTRGDKGRGTGRYINHSSRPPRQVTKRRERSLTVAQRAFLQKEILWKNFILSPKKRYFCAEHRGEA